MASKIVLALLMLSALIAVVVCQAHQGGSHVDQGGSHVDQGGSHVDQGGSHVDQGGSHVDQGGAHEDQGRVRRQVAQDDPNKAANWTTCDFLTSPKFSCHDCNTRVICKPVGGILQPCRNPYQPYCNNGYCSSVPSADCA